MDEATARLEHLVSTARRAEEMAAEWSTRRHVGRADEGRIVATTDAVGALVTLEISPLSRKRLDARRLADEILAAVTKAEQAAAASQDELLRGLHS
ncbi:YbaB/EbfC family nucleoid-associated protein [Nonomuraea terrae]|nr:YbaB/EbfC family nucleoid-associated protein [Nonomuraea terrae]